MQESWADADCEGYLKLANALKLREENILQRIFENSSSINYIKKKLHALFYDIVLQKYCPVLLSSEKGFCHLFLTGSKEALKLVFELYKDGEEEFSYIMQ